MLTLRLTIEMWSSWFDISTVYAEILFHTPVEMPPKSMSIVGSHGLHSKRKLRDYAIHKVHGISIVCCLHTFSTNSRSVINRGSLKPLYLFPFGRQCISDTSLLSAHGAPAFFIS